MKPILILLIALSAPVGAQFFPDRVYPIVELTDEQLAAIDLHDNSIDDWTAAIGDAAITGIDFYAVPGDDRALYDPADLDFRIWLAWHDATNRIYVAMERVDDIYHNDFQWDGFGWRILHEDSGMSLSIDGDHSGGKYWYIEQDFDSVAEQMLWTNVQAQTYYAIGEVLDDSPLVFLEPQGLHADWFLKPPYAEGGGGSFGENPVVSVTEFYITPFDQFIWDRPEESIVSDLYRGKVIGFYMMVRDYENRRNADSIHVFGGPALAPDRSQFHTDAFADGLLVGPVQAGIEQETVESASWARIKASFGR